MQSIIAMIAEAEVVVGTRKLSPISNARVAALLLYTKENNRETQDRFVFLDEPESRACIVIFGYSNDGELLSHEAVPITKAAFRELDKRSLVVPKDYPLRQAYELGPLGRLSVERLLHANQSSVT